MRENRPYGSEGGEGGSPSRPLSEVLAVRAEYISPEFAAL